MDKFLTKDRLLTYSLLIIYALFMSLFMFNHFEYYGDDLQYRAQFGENLLHWLASRYHTWSSRLLIDMFIPVLCYFPNTWRVVNVAVSLLLFYSLQKLLCGTHLSKFALLLVLLMFPYFDLANAGWISTTLNYWWPLSLGVFSLLSIKKTTDGEKLRWYEHIAYSAALLFAANNEQLAVILIAVFLAFNIYVYINTHKVNKYLIFQLVLCLISIIFIATAPGNPARMAVEIRRLPQLSDFSFFNKLYLGFSTTMHHVIIRDNLIFLTLCVLLTVVVFIKHTKWLYRAIAVLPIFISSLLKYFIPGSPNYWQGKEYLESVATIHIIWNFAFTVAILCIIISAWFAFGKDKEFLLIVFVMALGTLSRVMMGFSPTLFASDTRTFTFLWASIIYSSMIVCKKLEDILTPKSNESLIVVVLVAALTYMHWFP